MVGIGEERCKPRQGGVNMRRRRNRRKSATCVAKAEHVMNEANSFNLTCPSREGFFSAN